MPDTIDAAALVGSLRRESFTRKLVRSFTSVAPPALQNDIADVGDLPLYNQGLESAVPAAWAAFRTRIKRADAVR